MRRLALFAAGSNAKGQLANGTLEDSDLFMPCHLISEADSTLKPAESKRNLEACPDSCPWALPLHARHVERIAGGANHTLILVRTDTNETQVYGAGDDSKGQLGLSLSTGPKTITAFRRLHIPLEKDGYQVVDVAAAWETSFLVLRQPSIDDARRQRHEGWSIGRKSSDLLIAFGANESGDLGTTPPAPSDIRNTKGPSRKGKERQSITSNVPRHHIVHFDHLLPDKTAYYKISSITASIHHVIVLLEVFDSEGQSEQILVGWGACRHGQLGNPSEQLRSSKVKAKASIPPYLDKPTRLEPIRSSSGSFLPITRIASGSQHTVILDASNGLTGRGANRKNQLPDLDSQYLSENTDILLLGCTWNGTYLVVGTAKDWQLLATGSGAKGQLGRAPFQSASSSSLSRVSIDADPGLRPVDLPFSTNGGRCVRKLACGSEHVLLLVEPARGPEALEIPLPELYAWGWNEHGNLGAGHEVDVFIPIRIPPPKVDGFPAQDFKIADVWAGCGTSWLICEFNNPQDPPNLPEHDSKKF